MFLFRQIILISIVALTTITAEFENILLKALPTGSRTDAYIRIDKTNGRQYFSILRRGTGVAVQSCLLDPKYNNGNIYGIPNGVAINSTTNQQVEITQVDTGNPNFSLFRVYRDMGYTESAGDCFDFDSTRVNWYGGPEQYVQQLWPIQLTNFSNFGYVTKESSSAAIAERYWLNSRGSFIYVEPDTPLFIDQNVYGDSICLVAKKQSPYSSIITRFLFVYWIGVHSDAKQAHLEAVDRFLNKPLGIPNQNMTRFPIWSTWARYKKNINSDVVTTFANEIRANNFAYSQLEIDDGWESCYGSLTFNSAKFMNVASMTSQLKNLGFRVSLWVHPFINSDCSPYYEQAIQNGWVVVNRQTGSPNTHWWNGQTAVHYDFTKPTVVTMFKNKLQTLLNLGIYTFKFDAGETSWAPSDPSLNAPTNDIPNALTTAYVRMAASINDAIEIRTGFTTQDLPCFKRMIDKDSIWTIRNGMRSVITTLLVFNMAGYTNVLPDYVGGNGYGTQPTKELLIRWLQMNTFMPTLQLSFAPWQFDAQTVTICRKYTQLHATYANQIINQMQLAVSDGTPVNPPIWWVDPTDTIAQKISDQYMMGDTILVAPVLDMGATQRNVYLPTGRWSDGNNGTVYVGPRMILSYPAALDILPYFIKLG